MATPSVASAPATQFWAERGPYEWARVLPTYWEAGAQAHRTAMISAMRDLPPFESVRELGCAAGTNLKLIRTAFPSAIVQGLDVSQEAVLFAQDKFLRDGAVGVMQADILQDGELWEPGEVDVVVTCYTLAYVSPDDIETVMTNILRSARVGCVFVEPMMGETGRIHVNCPGLIEWRHDYVRLLDTLLNADPRNAALDAMPLPEAVELCDGLVRVTYV